MCFLGEKGGIPGLYFQADKDNPTGGGSDTPPETMKGDEFFTPEQKAELKKLAEERGAAAAAAQAMGMLDA